MMDIRVREGEKPFKAAGQARKLKVTGTVNQINIGKGKPQTVVTNNISRGTSLYELLKSEGLIINETDGYFAMAAYPGSERRQSRKVANKGEELSQ